MPRNAIRVGLDYTEVPFLQHCVQQSHQILNIKLLFGKLFMKLIDSIRPVGYLFVLATLATNTNGSRQKQTWRCL